MQIYTVKTGSVAVRQIASASSPVVNILPEGSTIYVVDEDSGWLRTSGGKYIFKTDNLESSAPQSRTMLRSTTPSSSIIPNYGTQYNGPSYDPSRVGGTQPVLKPTPDPTKQEETAVQNDTNVSSQDIASSSNPEQNRQSQINALSTQLKGNKVEIFSECLWNEDGTLATDDHGNYISKPITGDVRKDLHVVDLVEKNGKQYVIVESEADGNPQWVTELSNANIQIADRNGNIIFKKGDQILSDAQKTDQEKQEESLLEQLQGIGGRILDSYTNLTNLTVEDSRLIHGMPYQFMPIVDPRVVENQEVLAFNSFGRKFQEKIVARAPILYMQAGVPIFLRGYSDEAKETMLEALMQQIEASDDSELQKLLDDQNTQYYSFDEQSNLYFKAVNSACTVLAHLLQIESVQIPTLIPHGDESSWGQTVSNWLNSKSLGNINWALKTSHSLGFYRGAVAFYINTDSQIQETFINSSRQSELAGKINQVADSAKEAEFLLGGMGNVFNLDLASAAGQKIYGEANKNIGNGEENMLGSSFIGTLVNNISNLIAGGKMNFPEIWSDSTFNRSYNVTIKLNSPDCDTVSIFLNILVPLVHILGFVLPRSAGPNMYTSPFLVRCFYKSSFHIDMGIISSCQVTKGDTGAWNCDGLPTEVTVQLTIKDLYSHMSQASGIGNNTLIANPAQLEYLANLAGVNIAPASFTRALELWWAVKGINRSRMNLVGYASDMMQSVFKKMQSFSPFERQRM